MSESDRLEEATNEEIDSIKQWLKEQPHLPDIINELLLRRFLYNRKYDLEQTKKAIDHYFTLRHNAPEIFADRDPLSSEIQKAFKMAYICPLPKLSPDKYRVSLLKMKCTKPDDFSFNASTKVGWMLSDVRLATLTELTSDVIIFDMNGVSLRYLPKLVYSTLKKHMKYIQEAHPVRTKQIHVINAATYIDKMYNIVKPLVKSEHASLVYFHTPATPETLYKFIPKELLPEEYGGDAGKMEDINQYWISEVIAHRDYFLNESLWKVDESKRITIKNNVSKNSLWSFKSLSID